MRPRLNRSLTAHLRATEDHSRLPFHPSCPVCRRDRLAGSLDGEELVSRRTQAALAAGVLAFSTGGGSAVAVASPPDEVSEGTAEVFEDPGSDPEFDPGLETAQLPDEEAVAPLPVTADGDDIAVVEQEPATDTLESVAGVDLDEEADSRTVAPAPATSDLAPTPASAPSTSTADSAEGAPQEAQAGPKAEDGQRRLARPGNSTWADGRAEARDAPAVVPAPPETTPTPEPAVAPTPAAAPVTGQAVLAVDSATREAAPPADNVDRRDRVHTVRPGESLWSIAADLLGERASVASIAREVNRLWELNEERIGTGRPDLLYAGTRLRLR